MRKATPGHLGTGSHCPPPPDGPGEAWQEGPGCLRPQPPSSSALSRHHACPGGTAWPRRPRLALPPHPEQRPMPGPPCPRRPVRWPPPSAGPSSCSLSLCHPRTGWRTVGFYQGGGQGGRTSRTTNGVAPQANESPISGPVRTKGHLARTPGDRNRAGTERWSRRFLRPQMRKLSLGELRTGRGPWAVDRPCAYGPCGLGP